MTYHRTVFKSLIDPIRIGFSIHAAATQRSITNWVGFGFTSDIGEEFARDQMGLGLKDNVWNSMEKMWYHSPLKYLDQCVTPTLVIHSDEDYRCPISEGYQIYSALQQRGVETRMVIFHGENHELSRSGKPRHRIRRLKEISPGFHMYETHWKRGAYVQSCHRRPPPGSASTS